MRPTGLLSRLRTSQQESTCTITRPDSSNVTWDGTEYAPATIEVYAGTCLLQPTSNDTRVVQAGDRAVSLKTYRLTVPATVAAQRDDDVTVTASDDTQAVGMTLRVLDVPRDDLTTVRTLLCEEQD